MTSSSNTFPFGIADVVELLDLTRPPPSAVEPVPEPALLRGSTRAAQRQHGQKRLALQSLRCGGRDASTVCPL